MNWAPIFILAVVALLASMQALMWIRAKRSVGRPAPDTSSVDGPASADSRRLYYFYSQSCGPCRAMKPVVEKLSKTHRNMISVDIAQSMDLARKFSVAGTPSFVLVEGGAVREVLLGGQTERKLSRLLGAEDGQA